MQFESREGDNNSRKVVSHKSCIQNNEPERGKVMLQQSRENSGLKTMGNGELKKKKVLLGDPLAPLCSRIKGPQQY